MLDWLIDLARRSRHRFMVRLVKGAYWDSEIKRAQVDGQAGYPVYTRKVYTDVAYLACAKKLLAAQDAIFPQFATHNAYSLAAVYELGRGKDYEFQCLHGMGETLYDEVVGPDKLDRACRVYAPVGTHETLLAYLVRRLLENGANSSFVNRLVDPAVSIDELVADQVEAAARLGGRPYEPIPLPRELTVRCRRNSKGVDLSSELDLRWLQQGARGEHARRLGGLPDPGRRRAARCRRPAGPQSGRPRRCRRHGARGGHGRMSIVGARHRGRRGAGLGRDRGRRPGPAASSARPTCSRRRCRR